MSKEEITSRVWECVTDAIHPETGETIITKEKIDEVLNAHSSIKEYAYILHDKDTYTEEEIAKSESKTHSVGDLKSAHFHIVMRFNRAEKLSTLSKWFDIPENFFEKKKGRGAFSDSIQYLTHESSEEQKKGKYLYPDEEVVCKFENGKSYRDFIDNIKKSVEKYGTKDISLRDKLRMDVLYHGRTIREIKREYPIEYNNDIEALNKRRGEYLRDAPLPPFRINFYISGSGGAGKGLLSEALARALVDPEGVMNDEDIFCYVGSESVSFETYDGQPVVIWDDCRHNELFNKLGDRGNIFNVFDTKPKRIVQKKKYSQTNLINTINIVNSVEPINDFLDGLAGRYKDRYSGEYIDTEDAQKAQSYRRFPICLNVHPKYYDIYVYEPFFDDGKGFTRTIHKCNYAPLKEMIHDFGLGSKTYRDLCFEALKPVLDLYCNAEKILSHQCSCDEEKANELMAEVGKNTHFKEYLDKYYVDFCNFANDIIYDASKKCNAEEIVSSFCTEYGITDDLTINTIRCEVEDLIQDAKSKGVIS